MWLQFPLSQKPGLAFTSLKGTRNPPSSSESRLTLFFLKVWSGSCPSWSSDRLVLPKEHFPHCSIQEIWSVSSLGLNSNKYFPSWCYGRACSTSLSKMQLVHWYGVWCLKDTWYGVQLLLYDRLRVLLLLKCISTPLSDFSFSLLEYQTFLFFLSNFISL